MRSITLPKHAGLGVAFMLLLLVACAHEARSPGNAPDDKSKNLTSAAPSGSGRTIVTPPRSSGTDAPSRSRRRRSSRSSTRSRWAFLVTKQVNDIGAFKTPTLRNIAITAPYMHDGSMTALFDVMDHYNKSGVANPFLDGGMQRLGLTEPEVDDLVRFMETLTHPNGANTHPETYPKYQVQLGRVAMLRDMINWCIENPVRGRPLADDDPKLKAIEAFIYAQRKGVPLEYGKH